MSSNSSNSYKYTFAVFRKNALYQTTDYLVLKKPDGSYKGDGEIKDY